MRTKKIRTLEGAKFNEKERYINGTANMALHDKSVSMARKVSKWFFEMGLARKAPIPILNIMREITSEY
jgi:hypothetical protein